MKASCFSDDVQEFLRILAVHKVKYLIVGGEVPIYLIGLQELIKNKKAIGRPKDMEDLKYLKGVKKLTKEKA